MEPNDPKIKTAYDLFLFQSRLRDELVVSRLKAGETLKAIADDMGLTRQRVQQMSARAGYHIRAEKRARKAATQPAADQAGAGEGAGQNV